MLQVPKEVKEVKDPQALQVSLALLVLRDPKDHLVLRVLLAQQVHRAQLVQQVLLGQPDLKVLLGQPDQQVLRDLKVHPGLQG